MLNWLKIDLSLNRVYSYILMLNLNMQFIKQRVVSFAFTLMFKILFYKFKSNMFTKKQANY